MIRNVEPDLFSCGTVFPGAVTTVPADQWREADDKRENPDGDNEQLGSWRRHEAGVADGTADRYVAVNADGDQVVDRSGTHPHVDSQPDTTPRLTERPVVQNLIVVTFHRLIISRP